MIKLEKKLNSTVTAVVEGESHLDIFKALSSVQEVFGEEKCGKCESSEVQYRVRNVKDGKKEYNYPEMVCKKCYARLAYGTMEGGELFPVRFEREEGEYVMKDGKRVPKGKNGWTKYNKDTGKEE